MGIEKSSVSCWMSWCEQLDSQQETKGCFHLHSLFVVFDWNWIGIWNLISKLKLQIDFQNYDSWLKFEMEIQIQNWDLQLISKTEIWNLN